MEESDYLKLPATQRKEFQKQLQAKGLYFGPIDGLSGSGMRTAFDQVKKQEAEADERERKNKINEGTAAAKNKLTEAEAEEKLAEAERKRKKAEADARAAAIRDKAKEEYQKQESSTLGLGTKIAAGPGSYALGKGIGLGLGHGVNEDMNEGQRQINTTLQRAAEDRVKGLTTREGDVTGTKLSETFLCRSPALGPAGGLAPNAGLGAVFLGTGAHVLSDVDPDQPFFPRMADRAFG